MKAIKVICKCIDTFTEWTGRVFAFISLLTMAVIIFEVFMRRILNSPQIWTMDMIVMSFGCYIILISAFGFLRKAYVSVDVVYAMLPGIVRHILHIITYLIFFVPFSFELVPVTYRFFLRAYTTHELGYSVWQPVAGASGPVCGNAAAGHSGRVRNSQARRLGHRVHPQRLQRSQDRRGPQRR